ncbi:putative 2-phosphosulfolactate phosphatase [bioreactor metagenome]|uniref:2-phosphosulfolactate phosphatase n=1 Tax=bioreactor metagenome TaxID=1076179 RepID=A0A645DXI8_9ZZZZ
MKIDVAFLPKDIEGMNLSDTVCIVLDIFRATSSMTTALDNQCKCIMPVLSVDEAHAIADKIGPVLFAGERKSIKIEGFNFGNSPYEFSPDKVKNETIIMTTTNGTVAVKATDGAYRTLIGAFVNAAAVCRKARQYGKDILIVCAGTDRLFSLEDALCAGLLVKQLSADAEAEPLLTDSARAAVLLYDQASDKLTDIAINSRNGKRLYDLGRTDDVEYCFKTDILEVVPEYRDGKIALFNE